MLTNVNLGGGGGLDLRNWDQTGHQNETPTSTTILKNQANGKTKEKNVREVKNLQLYI